MKALFTTVLLASVIVFCESSLATERMLLVGGGKLPSTVVEKFVKHADKEFGRILVVGWASRGPEIAVQDFKRDVSPFFKGTIDASLFAPTHELERFRFLNQVSLATAIWFVGGYQDRIMTAFKQPGGEELKEALEARLREGVIIGGTSAGLAIMSNPMIEGGDSENTVSIGEGLGLAHTEMSPFILDQHFTQRYREERLIGALKLSGVPYGLGVDEETGILIVDRSVARVIGVYGVHAFKITGGQVQKISLKNGESFDLTTWKKSFQSQTSKRLRMSLPNISQ